MSTEKISAGGAVDVKEVLFQKLRFKHVVSGDLAAIALAAGGAEEINLTGIGNFLYVGGRFDFAPDYGVFGYWRCRGCIFHVRLPRVSPGLWGAGDTYVKVGNTIEVSVNGEVLISRPNVCAAAGSTAESTGDKHVVVHVLGTVPMAYGVRYTAFNCSEWILPLLEDPVFERLAFNKMNVHNHVTGLPVEFREVFVKKGRVVKVLVNASCREYISTVHRLYRVDVKCRE